MTTRHRHASKTRAKLEPYSQQLIHTASTSALRYFLESLVLAAGAALLSFLQFGWLMSIAVPILLVGDLYDVSERPPTKSKLIGKRLVQSSVTFSLSFVFGDMWGWLGSGLVSAVLASYLLLNWAEWFDEKLASLDKWLQRNGLE